MQALSQRRKRELQSTATYSYGSALLLILLVLLAGCSLNEQYVKADEATYDAIAPSYLRYVHADEDLTESQRLRRERLVNSWHARIQEGKKHE